MNTAVLAVIASAVLGIRAALAHPPSDSPTRQELTSTLTLLESARRLLAESDTTTAAAVLCQIPAAAWPAIRDAAAGHHSPEVSALADWLDPEFLTEPGIASATAQNALFAAEIRIRRLLQGET